MYLRPILLHAFLISNFQFDRSYPFVVRLKSATFKDNRHLNLMNKEGNASTLVYGEDPIESKFIRVKIWAAGAYNQTFVHTP